MRIIPEPRQVSTRKGVWRIPAKGWIIVSDELRIGLGLRDAVPALARWHMTRLPKGDSLQDAIRLVHDKDLGVGAEGYRLKVDAKGVEVRASTSKGLFYGTQTLIQIFKQQEDRRASLPNLLIKDWPDFPDRGVYYDVTRGRVPKLERLFELVDRLAHYKINQLQLYVEHTFAFRKHPRIGQGASPLTSEDILKLDAYCRQRYIELVPSLQSFGHMSHVTRAPEYHPLCEDLGKRKYVVTPKRQHRLRGWTLSPAVPDTYRFLDELYAEFLPLFSSKRFNACCDEVYDLGLGQSHALCERKGKGRVYVEHLLKLRKLAARYGKRIMFWGDIVLKYPELISTFPKDVTLLNWGYRGNYKFETCHLFRKAGVPYYGCPGTSSWVSLFPRTETSRANISRFAAMAKRARAGGLLNTDWGDGGHYNFLENSWYGFVFGAEQSWNTRADQGSFDRRFSTLFFNDPSGATGRAVRALGKVADHHTVGYFQSTLRHAYFLPRNDPFFQKVRARMAKKMRASLEGAQARLVQQASKKGGDPADVLDYHIFAADTLLHAARRIELFGVGGRGTPVQRSALRKEHRRLRRRFEKLWLARNRRSEIRISLRLYDQVAAEK